MSNYPLEPLLALTRSRETGLRMNYMELSKLLNVSRDAVQQWSVHGIPDKRLEEVAVAVGFDPYNVWPELLDDLIAEQSKPCENCQEPFVPTNRRMRFCSTNCRTNAWHRANYARNEAVRERRKAYRADYYAQAGEYERKRERARYWSDPEAFRQRARDARAKLKEAG